MRLDAVAIVPAGGAARRLGNLARGGKAAVPCGGRPLLSYVVDAVAAEVPRVIVVAAADTLLPPLGPAVEVIRDSTPGAGPLAAVRDGIAHAVAAATRPRVAVICSGDVPFVQPEVVRLLLDRSADPGVRWVLPVVDGHPQPLVSALAVDLLPVIDARLAAGHPSFRDLIAAVAAIGPGAVLRLDPDTLRAADPTLDSFRDVDTPDDLAAADRRRAAR